MSYVDLPSIHIPFVSRINPHQDEAARASSDWLESMGLLNPQAHRSLEAGRFFELASRSYPEVQVRELEWMISLISWIFLLDDALDQGALRNRVGEAEALLARLFSLLSADQDVAPATSGLEQAGVALMGSIGSALSPHGQQRLLADIRAYFDAVLKEIEARVSGEPLDLLAFAEVRRYTGATHLMFCAGEAARHTELPDAFCRSWPFQVLQDTASDVVVLVNDIFSYGKESHYDEINNYMMVCQHHLGLSLQEAMTFVNDLLNDRVRAFQQARARLPLFIERQRYPHAQRVAIERYVDTLKNWMSGNLVWSSQVPRYNDVRVRQGVN
ncbi:hypothetical protein AWM79_06180 [Pseudomonas agarici]|uniref:Terpene synthase n=2 Tax=Pseudomonas agarici TaxID=46677 RepID=A0A0X1SZE5_PSEAA|nr:hypothetical protein [Pseudomonas agarici]AMB84919.1 hypothetical protein AWM79_06180 [Pseudomonas agarici]